MFFRLGQGAAALGAVETCSSKDLGGGLGRVLLGDMTVVLILQVVQMAKQRRDGRWLENSEQASPQGVIRNKI